MAYENKFGLPPRGFNDLKDAETWARQLTDSLIAEFQSIQNSGIEGSKVIVRTSTGVTGVTGVSSPSPVQDIYRAFEVSVTAGTNIIPFSTPMNGTYIIVQCMFYNSLNEQTDLILNTSAQTASGFTVSNVPETGTLRCAILIQK